LAKRKVNPLQVPLGALLIITGCTTTVPEVVETNTDVPAAENVDAAVAALPPAATQAPAPTTSCAQLAPVLGSFMPGHDGASAPSNVNCSCRAATPVGCTADSDSCAENWKDAESRFRACFSGERVSAFRAVCGGYKAIVHLGRDSTSYSFYDPSSGALAGSISFSGPRSALADCQSFVPEFVPPVAKCVPVDKQPCPGSP